jgi:hypothetical protein
MLLNRVKIIASCAGGWVMVVAAHMACNTLQLPTTDPRYKCQTAPTNATWVNKLASIQVDNTDPRWCPIIIETGVGTTAFQSYASNVELIASALSPSMPRIDYSFANANNVVQSTGVKFFTTVGTQAVATVLGAYEVGTAGNVTTKRDYAHNTIYTTAGPATGDVWLDYNYKANPTISGATSQANGHIRMTANTPRVQQPVTYQWWLNGVLQGPPTGSSNYYQIWGKEVTRVGVYTFKAVVIDKRNTSYTLTRSVTVTAVCATGKIC